MEKKFKELLELRKRLKKKKPDFIRQSANKKKRLKGYRKSKGIDSKQRLKLKGHRKDIEKGYKSPKEVRGLSREGLVPVVVNSPKDLERLKESRGKGIVISSKVGLKKRKDIVEKVLEFGFKLLNIEEPKAYLEEIEEEIKKRQKKKEERKKEEEEKKKELEKRAKKKKEKLEEKIEDKKEKEKIEKDKVLTKRE